MIINIENLDQFKKETQGNRVLIDVWADWCGPCKMMAPILEEADDFYKNKDREFKIIKMNADNSDLSDFLKQYGVKSIPTFYIYENESIIDTKVGALPKHKFMDFISQYFH